MNIHDDISANEKRSNKSLNSRGSKYEVDTREKNQKPSNNGLPTGKEYCKIVQMGSSMNRQLSESGKKMNFSSNQKFGFFFKRRITWLNLNDREIHSNTPEITIENNKIQTSKYSWVTFLPKNLYEQFSKLANIYFTVPF